MNNRVIITNRQLTAITLFITVGPTILVAPGAAGVAAGRDAWLCGLGGFLLGLPLIWVYLYLGGLYPNKTFLELSQTLLGRWLGGLVPLFIYGHAFLGVIIQVWVLGDFMTTAHLVETPVYAVNLLFVVVLAIGLFYGLEAMARLIEGFQGMVLAIVAIILILLLPNIKIDHLLPMLERGVMPVMMGSIQMVGLAVLPLIVLGMIYPVNVEDVKAAKKAIFKGFCFGATVLLAVILMSILVMGEKAIVNLRNPAFLMLKEINVGIIFTRLEAMIELVWLVMNIGATLITFYSGAIWLAQWVKLRDYRVIVLPLALNVFLLAGFLFRSVSEQLQLIPIMLLVYFLDAGFMPVIMLIVALTRKWLRRGES